MASCDTEDRCIKVKELEWQVAKLRTDVSKLSAMIFISAGEASVHLEFWTYSKESTSSINMDGDRLGLLRSR